MHLDMFLRDNGFKYDVDIQATMPRRTVYEGAMVMSGYDTQNTFRSLIVTLVLFAPFLLYTKGGKLVKSLQQSRSRAKVPFFSAVASLAHVFNVYVMAKVSLIEYYGYEDHSYQHLGYKIAWNILI